LLLPGLGVFLGSAAAYVRYQRAFPASGLDLGIYRQAVRAFLAGDQVYDLRFTLGLPYTYPPVTLPLLTPLAGFDDATALHVLMAVSVVAVFLTVWFGTGLMGYRGAAGRLGVAGAVTGLALWLEPVSSNLDLGQVNAVLMLLIVADLALPDRNRFTGVGIGIAAACKLVPGIFVVYLLATRRFRAAAVAVGAFAATTLAGWVLAPSLSHACWLRVLFLGWLRPPVPRSSGISRCAASCCGPWGRRPARRWCGCSRPWRSRRRVWLLRCWHTGAARRRSLW
jgi:alpha-1,2-mannosyltransferase